MVGTALRRGERNYGLASYGRARSSCVFSYGWLKFRISGRRGWSLVACEGLNVWDHEWKGVPWPRLELPHPSYPWQRHSMSVYEITANGKCVRFAAGELSANVYGFYIPN